AAGADLDLRLALLERRHVAARLDGDDAGRRGGVLRLVGQIANRASGKRAGDEQLLGCVTASESEAVCLAAAGFNGQRLPLAEVGRTLCHALGACERQQADESKHLSKRTVLHHVTWREVGEGWRAGVSQSVGYPIEPRRQRKSALAGRVGLPADSCTAS